MKIVSLQAENFKRLKAVEIAPEGNSVVIAGKNAQGKSSVLDAIWAALAGKGGAVDRPIREGESKARVRLDLGEVIVERKWSGARTTLEVTAASGARFPSPQKMLDDLVGRLSFDPLAFATMDTKQQLATLIELADLPFDPDDLAEQRKAAYDERTLVNREVKALAARVNSVSVPDDTPDEEVDVIDLTRQIARFESKVEEKKRLLDEHSRLRQRAEALHDELRDLQNQQAEIVAKGNEVNAEIAALKPPEDAEGQVRRAEEINRHVRAKRESDALRDSLQEATSRAKALTEKIHDLDVTKERGMAAASLPVEGLSFDDEGVTYNDVPFSQASAAERLRVSVAMAMAMNPKVRVIRITDGSLLDSDNLALIEKMAADRDFQIWVERVDESGGIGVVIEDGEVKA